MAIWSADPNGLQHTNNGSIQDGCGRLKILLIAFNRLREGCSMKSAVDSITTQPDGRLLARLILHLHKGLSISTAADALKRDGASSEEVDTLFDYCHRDPVFSQLLGLVGGLAARDWLCHALFALTARDLPWPALRSVSSLSADEFATSHYFANRPVLVKGACAQWPAIGRWTDRYLQSRCGSTRIRAMAGRSLASVQEQSTSQELIVEMPFKDYVDRVRSGGPSNDLYMVARNEFFRSSGSNVLLADLGPRPPYFETDNSGEKTYMWFGPADTVTSLHFDARNAMLFQVRGRKQVRLFSPFAAPFLQQRSTYYSAMNCDSSDPETQAMLARAGQTIVTLEPGDGLFLPVGWWHHVKSLDISISISMTDFRFPNEYGFVDTFRSM